MAKLKLKQSIIFPESVERNSVIYIDIHDYKKKDYKVTVNDSSVITYIEKSGEYRVNTRYWEHAFLIEKFDKEKNNEKYKYFLVGQKAKEEVFVNQESISAEEAILRNGRESLKTKIYPGDLLDMTLTGAREEIDKRYDSKEEKDIEFLKDLRKELTQHPDEDLIEYLDPLLKNIEVGISMDDIDFNETALREHGIGTIRKLAFQLDVKKIDKFKSKKDLIKAVILAKDISEERAVMNEKLAR